MTSDKCPVCGCVSNGYSTVDGHSYYERTGCGLIHIASDTIHEIDEGGGVRDYHESYWSEEAFAAYERSKSIGPIRMAEAIFLCRRPVEAVIDIGTGTGVLLDEMQKLLPYNSSRIFGCELFPPPVAQRTTSPNYVHGTIKDVHRVFDAGLCMEVFEHLTPSMVSGILKELSDHSNDEACYVINTGLAKYVKEEDPGYIDPIRRGHIVSWTVESIGVLGKPFGLTATALPGREWAFLIEKTTEPVPIEARLYDPLPENVRFLADGRIGASVLSIAAAEASRCYFHREMMDQRTKWALDLQRQMEDVSRTPL